MTPLSVKMPYFKKFLIFFFYLIIIAYSLELLTTLTLKKQFNLIDKSMNELREEKIKKITNFDRRDNYAAFLEEKKKNNLYPSFRLAEWNIAREDYNNEIKNFIKNKLRNNEIIPFRGPINKKTLGSSEAGVREIIINDKFGYKNPNEVYEKKIDIMILGDSFAEGVPFDNENDITGILRKSANYNSINYGINGTGPLISLAIIKEYGKKFVPKNVFYLFYEGNDLKDMMDEKDTFLINYLDKNFTQNLINSQKDVENFLNEYEKVFNSILPNKIKEEKLLKNNVQLNQNNTFKEKIKDFLELRSIKDIIFISSVFDTSKKVNYNLFEKILKTMNLEINEWGGNFYFVYLPAWTRYNNQYSLANITLKNKIKKIVLKNNIQFIDIDSVFKDFKVNNVDIYNLSIYGHYTKYGYNLIADKLIKTLSN
mgnify:FL=1